MDQPAKHACGSCGPAATLRGGGARLVPTGLFAGCAGVLGLAVRLEPNTQGTGTHTALGLPACGFLTVTGLPCPTCGMTTSFAHAADGQFVAAFLTQPAGFVLALLTAMMMIVFGYAAVTGMSLTPLAGRLFRPPAAVGLGILLLGGWAYTLTLALSG